MIFRWLQPKSVVRRYRRSAGVSCVRHGDKIVLMSTAKEAFYALDLVGGLIWDLLEDHHEAEPIVAALQTEFDVPAEEIRRDVDEFLERLERDGLIEVGR
jgi:hypothetical protein